MKISEVIKKYLDSLLLKLCLVVIFCSIILFPQLKLIGFYFTGLDYLIYFLLLLLIPLKGNLVYEKVVVRKIFVIFLIGAFSLFISNYIKSYFLSILGFLIVILPFVSYFLFYNIKANENNLLELFRSVQIFILFVSISVIFNFLIGRTNDYGSPLTITKDIGFAATLCNVNIIISLTLYNYKKSKKHIIIILTSFIAIILISALKSLAMSVVVLLYYLSSKDIHKYLKQISYISVISLFSVIVFSSQYIQEKIKLYFFLYVTSDNSLEIARTASYVASMNIALDHFPFGSGPGTFGSYPVLITYNDLYYDYNLSGIWGLQEENLKDPSLPTFILDTYWPSPLAELGAVGFIVLLLLFFHPLLKISKLSKHINKNNLPLFKSLKFYIFALCLVLLFENLTLSSLSQVSIIILYFGFSGLIVNFIENTLIARK